MTVKYKSVQKFEWKKPPGDERERQVCAQCGFIDYQNPRVVVGSVALWRGKILLCRRAIEPRKGYWTLPAGFLELGETPEEGARREAREEACAQIKIDRLLAVYSIPRISQVQLMFRALLESDDVAVGIETKEVLLADWTQIPWADIAFPSVGWALRHYRDSAEKTQFAPFTNPIEGL